MNIQAPDFVNPFLRAIQSEHRTEITIRELLTMGKSGAFVAMVDCTGDLDGIHIMKVDVLPTDWDGEKVRHEKAISEGAFSGKIPQIALSLDVDGRYCMLIKLAGQSLIQWRPLVSEPGLFCSAYTEFSKAAWTPKLFTLGAQQPMREVFESILGYKLFAEQGGRIHKHVSDFISPEVLTSSIFMLHGELLPNPVVFSTSNLNTPVLRPFLGPTHGDCHSQNLFVKAGENSNVLDINLIDFATYQSSAPLFYDHAYLELATLLRAFNGLGLERWHKLSRALAKEDAAAPIDPTERGWLQDILTARATAAKLAKESNPDRQDDLKLQMLLAQVAAGLAFLHKVPRGTGGSGGLTESQYIQSFVWSAVFLKQLFDLIKKDLSEIFPNQTAVPWPLARAQGAEFEPPLAGRVIRLDETSFNILVVGQEVEIVPPEILFVPWSIVVDFRTAPPTSDEQEETARVARQSWPGERQPDLKILQRGCIWYYANGREDISGVEPASTTREWRQKYKRPLDDLLHKIAQHQSPSQVRALVLGDGLSNQIARNVLESIDMEFADKLSPVISCDASSISYEVDGIEVLEVPLETIVSELAGNREASMLQSGDALLPKRTSGTMELVPPPSDLLIRVNRDLTVLYRARAQSFPKDRAFGIDFRRGMPIEWAELAQQLDVPRENAFDSFFTKISEALEASSNRTVNLLHEPSSGGTTLARRLAWSFMERVPTVILDQISNDTSSYLRDLFQFCSLPVLVVMESSVVTESEREGLLQQLREDNTRAVFLAVTRAMKKNDRDGVLPGELDETERTSFLHAYLEQVDDFSTQEQLRRLAGPSTPREQQNPFFFGLTAYGEGFVGVKRLIENVLENANNEPARELLADLSLVSYYNSEGFPEVEFDELCKTLNNGKSPVDEDSLFLVRSGGHIRVSHSLLARQVLSGLARNKQIWRADVSRFSTTLLSHLSRLKNKASDRVQRMVQSLFITRDTESAILADVDFSVGGIANRRFSQLINDIGNAELARDLFSRVTKIWPREPHYIAHLARHLMYEDPRDIDGAVKKVSLAEDLPEAKDDAALVHVAGMAHRIRMEQVLQEAIAQDLNLADVEDTVRSDFDEAVSRFERSTQIKPSNEHGLVATIQTVSKLLRQSMRLAGEGNLSTFLTKRSSGFYMDALSLAEENIDLLNNRPRISIRAEKTIAEWNNVYGNTDRVVSDLRALAARHEDLDVRRALCAAIIARAKHKWRSMSQVDLRTVALMMEKNINQQGVRDADIRRWFSAYRNLDTFDETVANRKLIDWHGLSPKSVEPAYYLFAINFLRFLSSQGSREALASEVIRWNSVCQSNRPYGSRSWSYDWLEQGRHGFRLAHFKNDLEGIDPPSMIRGERPADRAILESRLARVEGTIRDYRGPQFASLDFGFNVFAKITPLGRLSKDDEGKRASAFLSFSYDGLIGWDSQLIRR